MSGYIGVAAVWLHSERVACAEYTLKTEKRSVNYDHLAKSGILAGSQQVLTLRSNARQQLCDTGSSGYERGNRNAVQYRASYRSSSPICAVLPRSVFSSACGARSAPSAAAARVQAHSGATRSGPRSGGGGNESTAGCAPLRRLAHG